MIYVAWADGDLTPAEIAALRDHSADQEWVDADARAQLDAWMDPDDPPSPAELRALLRTIHDAASKSNADERRDLASLGVAVARSDTEAAEADWLDSRVRTALDN